MFKGLFTAIITPFKNGKVDYDAFSRLIDYQIANHVDGLVVCGTTGEAPTLSTEEQSEVIKIALEKARSSHIKIIAGNTSNSTELTIQIAERNKKLGVHGILVATPPYNKPTQNGLYEHFKKIHDTVDIPIVLYNVPGRCGTKIDNKTVIALSKLKNIVGIKDATGDLALIPELRSECVKDFDILSGNDITTVGFNAMGGNGVISVISNIAPKLCSELQKSTEKNDFATAVQIQGRLAKLNKLLFVESNPIPVKYACSLLGYGDGELRLPLVKLDKQYQDIIKNEIKTLDLL